MEARAHIFTWAMAEELAAAHMRHLGFADARRTPSGADGGIDVLATGAVAQVKHHAQPVGAPDVQRLRGAAHGVRRPIFYARNGFTSQAIAFASRAEIALFSFDGHNIVTAVNEHALQIGRMHGATKHNSVSSKDQPTLEILRQIKATDIEVQKVIKSVRTASMTLRDQLESASGAVEIESDFRFEPSALASWVITRYQPWLEKMDATSEDEGMDLDALASAVTVLRAEQEGVVFELATVISRDASDLLFPQSPPHDAPAQ